LPETYKYETKITQFVFHGVITFDKRDKRYK